MNVRPNETIRAYLYATGEYVAPAVALALELTRRRRRPPPLPMRAGQRFHFHVAHPRYISGPGSLRRTDECVWRWLPDIVVGNQNSQAISIFLGMEMEEFHLRSP